MLSKIISAAVHGIDAVPITVETDIAKGMSAMNIVGLGDLTVKEARERIRSAICNSGLEYPGGENYNQHVASRNTQAGKSF